MTIVNRNSGKETKSDNVPWDIFKSDSVSFLSKYIKDFNDFQNWVFPVL